jgi:hypothetical protein
MLPRRGRFVWINRPLYQDAKVGRFYFLKAQTRLPLRSATAGTAASVKVLQNRELLSYLADEADCVTTSCKFLTFR